MARWRPLAEYGRATERKDRDQATGRRTWTKAAITFDDLAATVARDRERLADNPAHADGLERLGRERALLYKTLVLTGLRKGELASITVGQLHLEAEPPFLELEAADEKNREGSTIPLRSDLAADLRGWLAERTATAQETRSQAPTVRFDTEAVKVTKRKGANASGPRRQIRQELSAVPALAADAPLFNVPDKLIRILDRDLAAAGIPKRDDRGRTVDVHALRHCFGTLLSKGGVTPRTAQAAMRHSSIDLTMNVYTDPRLLDVAAAMESLPSLPLDGGEQEARIDVSATGTDGKPAEKFAPKFAPATGK